MRATRLPYLSLDKVTISDEENNGGEDEVASSTNVILAKGNSQNPLSPKSPKSPDSAYNAITSLFYTRAI